MRSTIRRTADRLGVTARAYDVRARLRYLGDRTTRRRNAEFRSRAALDGLPLPPAELVYAVAGHFDVREYYESGASHGAFLRRILHDHQVAAESLGALLDFGCGCGRVVRQWRDLTSTDVHGSDLNARLVAWCRTAFPFASFSANGLAPPLAYPDDRFDFIYAISVFTHLPEHLQRPWMLELERVLAPNGLLVVTTKGHARADELDRNERARFERGELVVRDERFAGKNLCAAYHSEQYVRERLAGALEVVEFLPANPEEWRTQDATVFRKRASTA